MEIWVAVEILYCWVDRLSNGFGTNLPPDLVGQHVVQTSLFEVY